VSKSTTVVLCVPTPLDHEGEPDLSLISLAIENITPFLSEETLIVNESTSFPGTLRSEIESKILGMRPDLEGKLYFGVAPERVSPGSSIPLSDVPRVIAGVNPISASRTFDFYSVFCKRVITVETPEIAEMTKLLENSFRLVNIGFINEFNNLCRKLGIDTRQVIDAASTKPYGFMRFEPSAGIGGHCIPVDPVYLQMVLMKEAKTKSEMISTALRLNKLQAREICERVFLNLEKFPESALLLGVAYKAGLSDTRESPAVNFKEHLENNGIKVSWFDSLVTIFDGTQMGSPDDDYDFALILVNQPDAPIDQLKLRGTPIFDCTGEYREDSEIIQI
jgi:UDP-N-acetyl-D-glucosamine dehydrogenase